jgi:hypothetical protein
LASNRRPSHVEEALHATVIFPDCEARTPPSEEVQPRAQRAKPKACDFAQLSSVRFALQ